MNTLEILEAGRSLISNPERWTRGCFGRDSNGKEVDLYSKIAVRWCSVGALRIVGRANEKSREDAFQILENASIVNNDLMTYNDTHTHAEVLALWDEVIEKLRKEGHIENNTTKSHPLLELECYDAGLLSNWGGGDVDWWQDYIREELGRAYEFYQQQVFAHNNFQS